MGTKCYSLGSPKRSVEQLPSHPETAWEAGPEALWGLPGI